MHKGSDITGYLMKTVKWSSPLKVWEDTWHYVAEENDCTCLIFSLSDVDHIKSIPRYEAM